MKIFSSLFLSLLLLVANSQGRKPPTTTTTTATTTTTVTSTSGISYADQVKTLIDAGTCDEVVSSSTCGSDSAAEAHYEEFLYGGKRVVIISGAPGHAAEQDAGLLISSANGGYFNPNTRCSRWQYAVLDVEPALGNTLIDLTMGTVGFARSGGVFYDVRSSPDGELAWHNEINTLDTCMGHSSQNAQYHYHGVPYCMLNDMYNSSDSSQCIQIGYMLDGYPIFGLCQHDADGSTLTSCYVANTDSPNTWNDYDYINSDSCHLDAANGYTFADGTYGYVTTDSYPGVPRGSFVTTSASACGFTPE